MTSRKAKKKDPRDEREGDVLGISNADPAVEIPRPPGKTERGHEGIEVRDHATGIADLRRGTGATGIDMGSGGTGTDVEPATIRRTPPRENEDK
jgi:hypothetical protein